MQFSLPPWLDALDDGYPVLEVVLRRLHRGELVRAGPELDAQLLAVLHQVDVEVAGVEGADAEEL